MVASSLVDSVFSEASSSDRSRRIISQLIQTALSELAQIEKLDDSLAPENPMNFDRRTAALMQDEYERWACNTASLLDRIDRFERVEGVLPDSESLRHAYGKTRARLSTSVDEMEQSMRDLVEGRLFSVEEVRRGVL